MTNINIKKNNSSVDFFKVFKMSQKKLRKIIRNEFLDS